MTFTEALLIANPDWIEILTDEQQQGQLKIDYD